MSLNIHARYKVDLPFLMFLILVTQGNIQVKLVGVFLILLLRFRGISKIRAFSIFYILIILFHLFYGSLNIFFHGLRYITSYILVLMFWIIAFVIHAQSDYFIRNSPLLVIRKTVNTYFSVCVITVIIQYLRTSIVYGSINPYAITPAAGDLMQSIFSNSSVSMIIMSFFFIYYIFYKMWRFSVLALVCLLMASYMSGTVIFLAAMLLGILIYSKIRVTYKIYFLVFSFIFSMLFIAASPANYNYALGYMRRIVEFKESDLPFKIKSFWQTFVYWTSSLKAFVFGAGGGNFSSRVAFITSGDYVDWFPKSLVYISDEFAKNHFGIWTYDFNNIWDNRNNTANQPFSFYNKIIGEYGIIGISIFVFFYIKVIFKSWKILTYSKFMLVSLAGYFLLDYWFEYFSVMVIFEIMILMDLKLNAKNHK